MIEGHGDDLFRYGDKIKYNFSSNIPQSVSHVKLTEYLNSIGDVFRNYPEPAPVSVESMLAAKHDVDIENIIVTNGATETIYLLAHLFMKGKSAIFKPTFREYQDACLIFNHSINFIDSLEDIKGNNDVIWLCNPNNPTGLTINRDLLLSVIDRHKDSLFVIDQAYGLYSVKDVLTTQDAMERTNIVLLQSFTKRYTVPGLRIGYALGNKNLIRNLKSLRMPWSVGAISIEAAKFLLTHDDLYLTDFISLHKEAERMIQDLRACGFDVADTHCNFFLAQTPTATSAQLKTWLVENYGILIRDASNFEGLSGRHFRISAQTRQENNILIKALKEWIS